MPTLKPLSLIVSALLLAACGSPQPPAPASAPTASIEAAPADSEHEPDERHEEDPLLAEQDIAHVVLSEAFISPLTPEDNIDSPASWVGPDGQRLVIATAKSSHRLMLYRGDSGEPMGTVGERGTGPGQLDRPNGIFVMDDLVAVVERDNRRVQVLALPGFEPLGSFGESELRKPYGLWLRRSGEGYEVKVSDAYMDPSDEDLVPPLDQLGQRFQRYHFARSESGIEARHLGSFGATDPAGAIRIPESLWGDETHGRLLISEEDVEDGTRIKLYSLANFSYAGSDLGAGLFRAQSEGIALYACEDGSGHWIATDQFKDRSLFHVFDRISLEHRGAFTGEVTRNTDGIWLDQTPSERFPQGVFYGVHDDQGVAAFDWSEIAAALGLKGCG